MEIVDFKAGDAAETPAEREHVHTQLDIYALGAQTALEARVPRQTAHFLKSGRTQSWTWDAAAAARTGATLAALAGEIAAQRFGPRTDYCPRCSDFRALCPYGAAEP